MPTNCLNLFDHFVGLALKGLKTAPYSVQKKIQPEKAKYLKQKAKLFFQKFFKLNLLTFSKAYKAYIWYCNFIDDEMQLIQEDAKLLIWRVPY